MSYASLCIGLGISKPPGHALNIELSNNYLNLNYSNFTSNRFGAGNLQKSRPLPQEASAHHGWPRTPIGESILEGDLVLAACDAHYVFASLWVAADLIIQWQLDSVAA
jgi:hypothetical protein